MSNRIYTVYYKGYEYAEEIPSRVSRYDVYEWKKNIDKIGEKFIEEYIVLNKNQEKEMSEEIKLDELSNEELLGKIKELTVYAAYLVHKTTSNLSIDYDMEFEKGKVSTFSLKVKQNDN